MRRSRNITGGIMALEQDCAGAAIGRRLLAGLAAGTLSLVTTTLAFAAEPTRVAAAAQPAGASDVTLEEILVTARRRAENLQDVPQTVIAVTADNLEKLNILRFDDIDKVVAGIQLQGSSTFNASSSARGVTFQVASAAFSPTVAQYVNDAPVLTNAIFQSIFDIGQIEVLRGPQGTLHGISSPSGAMTFTTRKPDLQKVSADINTSISNLHGRNIQAAASIPLIKDKLAVRAALLWDETDAGGVRSVNSSVAPSSQTQAQRLTVRFQPVENFTADLMYQRTRRSDQNFGGALFGTGAAATTLPTANAPANYNGPPLGIYDFLTVGEQPSLNDTNIDFIIAQLDWQIGGQQLSYVGSKQNLDLRGAGAQDSMNWIPGYDAPGRCCGPDKVNTHELRLSSVKPVGGMLDYVVGVFNNYDHVYTSVNNGPSFQAGAFGSPLSVITPRAPNLRYVPYVLIESPRTSNELSYFANATLHFGKQWEVSAGGRRIRSDIHRITDIKLSSPAFIALPLPAGTCAAIGGQFAATYPNVCDRSIGGSQAVPFSNVFLSHNTWIYDFSASYHVNPDLMFYLHSGSSWREGPYTVGITNATNDPALNKLTFIDPEKSRSHEVGMKWTFNDRRGRLNVDYYHQTFTGLIYSSPFGVYYLANNGASSSVATYNFNSNADAKIDGFDVELAYELTRNWTASGNASWANGKLSNATIPCNDGNFDGTSDTIVPTVASFTAAGKTVAYCMSNASTSTAPKWNVNMQSEYAAALANGHKWFVRGLLSYNPENPNASQTYVTPAYYLLNLYAGLRDRDQKWELSVYAKNATNTQKILSQSANTVRAPSGIPWASDSGYRTVTLSPRREFGLNVRYSYD